MRYNKYKDSGIEWIGEIPEHWNVKKLNYCFRNIGSGTTPTSTKSEYYDNGEYNWLQTGDLTNNEIFETSKKITELALKNFSTLRFYPINSIVIAMYGATIGKTGILKIESTTNQACCVMAEPLDLDSKYVFYWFNSIKNHVISLSYGGGQPNINQEQIRSLKIQIPTFNEQFAIAAYLDRKTTEIDQIIANKQKLITLYEEEKQAIINQAVTKGLDFNVKFIDSEIEWLSEIPEHWTLKKIGYCSTIVRGGSPRPSGDPRYFCGDYMPWITVKEVTNAVGKFIVSTDEYLTEEGSKLSRIILPETLLLSNSGATLGVPKISKIKGCINDGSVAFTSFRDCLLRDYLYHYFVSHTNIYREEMKGNGQPNLNTEIIKSTLIPVPPIEEQLQIIDYIETECKQFDVIIEKFRNQVILLQEYRTTLISEVVTGKIKVPNTIEA